MSSTYKSPIRSAAALLQALQAILTQWHADTHTPPSCESVEACLVAVRDEVRVRTAQFKKLQPKTSAKNPLTLTRAQRTERAEAHHALQVLVPALRLLYLLRAPLAREAGWKRLRRHLLSMACAMNYNYLYADSTASLWRIRHSGMSTSSQRIARELAQSLGLTFPAQFGKSQTIAEWLSEQETLDHTNARNERTAVFNKLDALLQKHPVLSEAEMALLRQALGQR